jgi:hypothetical protein
MEKRRNEMLEALIALGGIAVGVIATIIGIFVWIIHGINHRHDRH